MQETFWLDLYESSYSSICHPPLESEGKLICPVSLHNQFVWVSCPYLLLRLLTICNIFENAVIREPSKIPKCVRLLCYVVLFTYLQLIKGREAMQNIHSFIYEWKSGRKDLPVAPFVTLANTFSTKENVAQWSRVLVCSCRTLQRWPMLMLKWFYQ